MEREKHIDEGWKEAVQSDKVKISSEPGPGAQETGTPQEPSAPADTPAGGHDVEINFFNYVAGLAYQAMIFLGDIPNPLLESGSSVDLVQAKMLIDTLILLRDKTKGNLTPEEGNLLNGALYELQMRYVEKTRTDPGINPPVGEGNIDG